MEQQKNKRYIGTFKLAMINVAAIISIPNLPIMSVTGLPLVSYFLLAAIFFFLPMSFVSAELATGWPLRGGFYSWVKLALGPHFGFLAIWLQWAANIVWYPTIMAPAVAGVAYLISPAMATNHWFMFLGMNIAYWLITFLNLRGMKESSTLSAVGVILGSIIPGLAIVVFAIIWFSTGHGSAIAFHWNDMVPPLTDLNNLVLLTGLITTLTGMEMSAVHVNDVRNPQRHYPKAIFICVALVMGVSILAATSLAVMVPAKDINLVAGMMQGYELFCHTFGIGWLSLVIGILLAIGMLTMASTWIGGPAKGVQVAATDGDIPHFFHKLNKREMPFRVMMIEGFFFSSLTTLFLILPSVTDSFWALIALTGELYMAMYFILFITGIVMRYRYPLVYRSYRIPGGKYLGMWLVAGAGIIGTILSFLLSMVPPTGFNVGNASHYIFLLLSCFSVITFVPLFIFSIVQYRRRHDSPHRELVLIKHASHVPVREIDPQGSAK